MSLRRLWDAEHRNEVLAMVVLFVAIQLFPKGVPVGIYGLGVVTGCSLALQAIGLVLVYRSNRIINFAQVQIGATAATIFVLSAQYTPILRWTQRACPPCVGRVTPLARDVNYWFSLAFALLLSVALAYAVYLVVVRRFANAPRLVLTVATIFVAQGLPWVAGFSTRFLTTRGQREGGLLGGSSAPLPFDISVKLAPAQFHLAHILTVVAAVAAGLGLFVYLRRSTTGTAIRAASENPDRAGTLGVNVGRVAGRVWITAGLLSGVAALLTSMTASSGSSGGIGVNTLVEILAIAVVARMTSLPLATAGAIAFGILRESIVWSYGSTVPLDGALVVIVGGLLLLQRHRASRAELEQASAWQATREIRPTPPELRSLPVVRKWTRIILALVAAVVIAFPWLTSSGQTSLGSVIMINAVVGLSLLILTGWAGQISLGQFGFAAIGGYVAAVSGLPFPLALLAGALCGAAVAVLVGLPALKLQGLHLAISTLAFALATTAVLLNPRYLGKHLPAVLGRPVIGPLHMSDERSYYYLTLMVLAVVTVMVVGLRRSRTARVLIAGRDNDRTVQSFGVNLVRARLGAFAISGFLAALAGGLLAFQQTGVRVNAFSAEQSITLFLMAVIGGLGSVSGPIIGAVYLGLLGIFGATPLVSQFATGFGGLALLLMAPGGLAKLVFDLRDAGLRRVASRNHIDVPSLVADRRRQAGDGRAPILPKVRVGGGTAFVPDRYQLDDQWALGIVDSIVTAGAVDTRSADDDNGDDTSFHGVSAEEVGATP
jgi:branched-chain amino acid transport system permease protein